MKAAANTGQLRQPERGSSFGRAACLSLADNFSVAAAHFVF
jgi:hypothetical protein